MKPFIRTLRTLAILLAVYVAIIYVCNPPGRRTYDDGARSAIQTARAEITPTPTLTPVPSHLVAVLVEEVVDGDTIKVRDRGRLYTVRYIGIDAPETVHPNKAVEWMGPEASRANRAYVLDKVVLLEKDVSETDRYGRLLRYVWLSDGDMVNEVLVRRGYAHASTYAPDVKYQHRFLAAEREAREAKVGLWSR